MSSSNRSPLAPVYGTDITSVASAAAGMNKMKQEILFYKRAYEDSSQNALWRYMLEYFVRRYTELVKEKAYARYRKE